MMDIGFSAKVKITKTDLVTPTLSSFLSEVGLKDMTLPKTKLNIRLGGQWVSGLDWGLSKCFNLQ